MGHHHVPVVFTLITALILSGCQSGRPTTVADYRPGNPAIESKAHDSQVFVLWRWTPVEPASTAATQPAQAHRAVARQFPVEVVQVFADRGSPVGFRRRGGKLIAVAGATTRPLDEAHYTWRTMGGEFGSNADAHFSLDKAGDVAIVLVAIAVVGGLIFFAFHENRHGWTLDF